MPDLDVLRADAEAAREFSEMAGRRLLRAQTSLAARAARWKERSRAPRRAGATGPAEEGDDARKSGSEGDTTASPRSLC
jgi:hypothetical protein